MKIVFFGSSHFAIPSLEALLTSGHDVCCVVTQPDKQKGRGFHLGGTALKSTAVKNGIPIYQPDDINSAEAIKFLGDFNPDLFVVIAYGQVLSKNLLSIPKIFAINLHASLLPKYRGAAPINWALINAEKTTGVTIIKMSPKMDAGPIISQQVIPIDALDTTLKLEEKLSKIGSELLIASLDKIANKQCQPIIQDEKKATPAPKLTKNIGLVDWNKKAEDIYNLIRGCAGWPGAYTYLKGKTLKIHKAEVFDTGDSEKKHAGTIIKVLKNGILVTAGKGNILITELQLEGKRIMKASEFVAGHKIIEGDVLS